MRLLIVDGSNMVMRSAFGGEIAPGPAVITATNLIERAAGMCQASHLVVALDCPGAKSWRKELFPDYKAHRSVDTGPWITAAAEAWLRRGWWLEAIDGFEADDVIATVAVRAKDRGAVFVLSGDSDLLPLTAEGIGIVKPVNGGRFESMNAEAVCVKYKVSAPARLVDLKAMTGETGDNLPGVMGIGEVRGRLLLGQYEDLEGVIAAGLRQACKWSAMVSAAADTAKLCYKLATLVRDVPVVPISPSGCVFNHG